MTQNHNLTTSPTNSTSLLKPILLGAGIALALIAFFLLQVKHSDPAWPKYWMARPLIIVPLAGACGGVFYYLMNNLRSQGSWKTVVANILSLIVYIFGLWMGTVLGLVGTLWN